MVIMLCAKVKWQMNLAIPKKQTGAWNGSNKTMGDSFMDIWIGMIGLSLGSFLNTCIYRIPRHQSIIWPRSYCTSCGRQIRSIDLVPFFSWIFLHGRCYYCQAPISCRYAVIEVLTSIISVIVYKNVNGSAAFFAGILLIGFLISIAFIDYDWHLIFDKVLLSFAFCGGAVQIFLGQTSYLNMLLGFLTGGGCLLLFMILSHGGMGGGDVKFAAALGIWFGWQDILLILWIAFVLGGLAGIVLLATGKKTRKDFVPFGPFLAFAAFFIYLYGNSILSVYKAIAYG